MLMAVPLSTVAQSTTYYMRVECEPGFTQSSVTTLVFLGHSLVVVCGADTGYHEKEVSFVSGATGTYFAQLIADGEYQFQLANFGPASCFVEGEQYGQGFSSWAYFEIFTSFCD